MGLKEWFQSIRKDRKDKTENPTEDKKVIADFVKDDELEEYETSLYGKLDMMKADLKTILEIVQSQGKQLISEIEALQNKLSNAEISDSESIKEFESLNAKYKELHRLAEGQYKINELKRLNHNMQIRFKKPLTDIHELDTAIQEYSEYIVKLQASVKNQSADSQPILTDVQRQIFYRESLRAEYRLKMLIIMQQVAYSSGLEIENPFTNLSETKQKLFAAFLLEDAKEIGEDFHRLEKDSELIGKYYINMEMYELDACAQELDTILNTSYIVKSFSPQELFDTNSKEVNSTEFLRKMVLLRFHTNQIKEDLPVYKEEELNRIDKEKRKSEQEVAKAKQEEQERVQKQKEKEERINQYKGMTEQDIGGEIKKIEGDLSRSGSRYVHILDFQKELARTRGLLPTEKGLQDYENLTYIPVGVSTLFALMKVANKEGINYTVFPGAQEFSDSEEYLFVISKSDSSIVDNIENLPFSSHFRTDPEDIDFLMGEFTMPVMWMIHSRLQDSLKNTSERMQTLEDEIYYDYAKESGKYKLFYIANLTDPGVAIKSKKKALLKETVNAVKTLLECYPVLDEFLKDIKCYIEVPAQRNILPILEELKKVGIDYYFEPEPEPSKYRNQRNRNMIRIYIDRENHIKYNREHQKLDVLKNFILQGVTIDFGRELLRKCTWREEEAKSR